MFDSILKYNKTNYSTYQETNPFFERELNISICNETTKNWTIFKYENLLYKQI